MRAKLEWSTLDIDEDEWASRVAGTVLDGAFDNSLAVDDHGTIKAIRPRAGLHHMTWLLGGAAIAIVLAAAVSYGLWRTAQEGVTLMQQDVATAVQSANIKGRVAQPGLHERAVVESVEFVDGKAMAQTLITRTLPSGHEVVRRQMLFYMQTPKGWQPTTPVAAFWGDVQTLDTSHLHFVFGSKDSAVVKQLAPGAELLYVASQRATGQTLVAPASRLVVEVRMKLGARRDRIEDGRMLLPSSVLFDSSSGLSSEQLLAYFTRETLANRMLDMELSQVPLRPQWQPVVEGIRAWLLNSNDLPLAIPSIATSDFPPPGADRQLHLADLLGVTTAASHTSSLPWSMYDQERVTATAASLIGYMVATFGIDVLPVLLRGFGKYADWETLAPAVFGVSAHQLEEGWRHSVAGGS